LPGAVQAAPNTLPDHGRGFFRDGWGLVSICEECWAGEWWNDKHPELAPGEHLSQCSYITLDRYERGYAGCAEPMMTNIGYRAFYWGVCSSRCYQRVYRKRRREHGGSTVPWKASGSKSCPTCKRSFKPSRKDARYCCNACRQKQYRTRLAASKVEARS
jgi:hypothetical protein